MIFKNNSIFFIKNIEREEHAPSLPPLFSNGIHIIISIKSARYTNILYTGFYKRAVSYIRISVKRNALPHLQAFWGSALKTPYDLRCNVPFAHIESMGMLRLAESSPSCTFWGDLNWSWSLRSMCMFFNDSKVELRRLTVPFGFAVLGFGFASWFLVFRLKGWYKMFFLPPLFHTLCFFFSHILVWCCTY